MRRFSHLILLTSLLAGCSDSPAALNSMFMDRSPVARSSRAPEHDSGTNILPGTKGMILPGSKGEILPGSKGSILPGTKGERTHLASLEIQLHLPLLDSGFAIKQANAPEADWFAIVDGERAAITRLVSSQAIQGERVLSFVLEDIKPLMNSEFQEIVFYSADGLVQSAAVVPALKVGDRRLQSPMSNKSLAAWLIAKSYQLKRGRHLQDLELAAFYELMSLPELSELAEQLDQLYRKNKGRSDLDKAAEIQARTELLSQKLDDKIKKNQVEATSGSAGQSNGNAGNGQGNGNAGNGQENGNAGNGQGNGNAGNGQENGNAGNGQENGNAGNGQENGNAGNGQENGNAGNGPGNGNAGNGQENGNAGNGQGNGNHNG